MKYNTSRILLITLSNIGDAIMTTPVLQALHDRFPDVTIDIVGDSRSDQVFKYCPYRGRQFQKIKHGRFIDTIRFLQCLRKTKYDLIVDLRTDGLAYLLRARKRLTKWRCDKRKEHAVEQYMSVINGFQKNLSIPPTTLWLDESYEYYARNTLSVLPGEKWLAIGPGCGGREKVWPGEYYRELVEQCSDLFDAVILIGSQGDARYAGIVTNGLQQPCINLCGKTDLLQAAAILKQSIMFIGSDSGLGHIASAVSVPTISLFGVGFPERYRPWGGQAVWLKGKDREIKNISIGQAIKLLRSHTQQIYSFS